jgi:tRNA pseudouridine55 synthase
MARADRLRQHGFLLLDKPSGITSHDAVSAIRRIFGQREVGHAGTLDPMATASVLGLGTATASCAS